MATAFEVSGKLKKKLIKLKSNTALLLLIQFTFLMIFVSLKPAMYFKWVACEFILIAFPLFIFRRWVKE